MKFVQIKCWIPYLENRGIFRVIWEAWQSIFRIDIRHRFLRSNIVRICACHLLARCTPWQWPGPLFPPPAAKSRWQCAAGDLDTQCRHCCRKLLLYNSHWCSPNPALRATRITVFGCDQLRTWKNIQNIRDCLYVCAKRNHSKDFCGISTRTMTRNVGIAIGGWFFWKSW